MDATFTDEENTIIALVYNALADVETPLSTIEIWHAVYDETKVPYHRLKDLLKRFVANSGGDMKVKMQVNGFGRRDYYLDPKLHDELRDEWDSA